MRNTTETQYHVSSEPADLDLARIHDCLTQTDWARGISRERLERAFLNSVPFVLLDSADALCGFARVISDRATFAYLADVFILPSHRGRGLAHVLLQAVLLHPDLQGVRRFLLATTTAADLYARYGFESVDPAQGLMQRRI